MLASQKFGMIATPQWLRGLITSLKKLGGLFLNFFGISRGSLNVCVQFFPSVKENSIVTAAFIHMNH